MTVPNMSQWIGQPVRAKEFEKCLQQSLATNIYIYIYIFFFLNFWWDGLKFSCSLILQSIIRKWVYPYRVN